MSTAKTALAATPQANGYDMAGYYPQQQAQQTHQSGATDPNAPSNSLAHSQGDYDGHSASLDGDRPARFTEEWDASQRGSSILRPGSVQRSASYSGHTAGVTGDSAVSLSRGNTLKKKASLRRSAGLKRSGSRRSMKAGSVRSLAFQSAVDQDETHNAFYCPVPTAANPTEALASRFQAWRKILKDLITYFREIQTHYEHRGKSLLKLANVVNNTATPPGFLATDGLDDALQILRSYNKQAIVEANKAREIEEDVILALTGLRSDLHQKIKEIKNLSGDFKNSLDKEMDNTRRAVNLLQEALGHAELDPSSTIGKQDPYLLRLVADRQLERQIEEENYLHQAYLNLESSGKELESIVVGEIQKAYNAYSGILRRESDAAYQAIEDLRTGPIAMPKDKEWNSFIRRDDRFVDPEVPMRSADTIHYPGRDHYACQEIRAGLLERKSKYLKSYTPGWYVLSPTHLHEFKSADKAQAPVMSLYLPEQQLGSHSADGSSSNKFVLKGRQTGSMHRGHKWVFRAESHDTMMAWYEDIKAVTERSPEERSNLIRANSRSISRSSQRSSVSSDGVDDEEEPPFTATVASVSQQQHPRQDGAARRPSGGRFPSDLQVNAQRGLQAPVSPVSVSSGYGESFNHHHHDPFVSNSHSGDDAGPQSLGFQGVSLGRGHEHQPVGGPVQHPGLTGSRVVSGLAENTGPTRQNLPPTGAPYAGTSWAEPIPIRLPQQPQPLSPTRDTTRDSTGTVLYSSQGTTALNGNHDSARMGPGTSYIGDDRQHGVSGSAAEHEVPVRPAEVVRTDSVPTISNLHVPGEYPRGPNAGL